MRFTNRPSPIMDHRRRRHAFFVSHYIVYRCFTPDLTRSLKVFQRSGNIRQKPTARRGLEFVKLEYVKFVTVTAGTNHELT